MLNNGNPGRLSYRGLLALGIGLVFLLFAVAPDYFNDVIPPLPVRALMLMAGIGLVIGGLASLRFVWRRNSLVRAMAPVTADICILADDDSDRGTETVHVRLDGGCQALGVDRSGVAARLADGTVRRGEVWLDEHGKVHAVAIAGVQLQTLVGGRKIEPGAFGRQH